MIFLLNREYVVWEVVELTRLHLCEILKIPTSAVEATVELDADTLSPEFAIDADVAKGVSKDDLRKLMARVYADCKEELEVRLQGVMRTRNEVLQELRSEPEANPGEASGQAEETTTS